MRGERNVGCNHRLTNGPMKAVGEGGRRTCDDPGVLGEAKNDYSQIAGFLYDKKKNPDPGFSAERVNHILNILNGNLYESPTFKAAAVSNLEKYSRMKSENPNS